MKQQTLNKRGRTPWILLLSTGYLVSVGSVVLFAIAEGAINEVGFSQWKHLLHLGVGVAVLLVAMFSDYHVWFRLSSWFYWVSVGLMAAVLFADPVSGSTRWIELGFIQFQPSELAKLATVLLLARLFSRRKGEMSHPWNFILSIVYVAIPTVLTLLQPDLGTALIFVAIWAVMIAISDIRPIFMVTGVVAAVTLASLAVPLLADYQQQRIMTFLDPAVDAQGAGYNVRQASIAIGSGGWFGQGLDSGTQSRLSFLPAQHTDFVFATTAEKLGFVGITTVIGAFAVLVAWIAKIGFSTKEAFAGHICLGIAAMLALHIVINIGMNLGVLPVTGLPLPFISYGGTHLLMVMASVGIVASIARHNFGLNFEA